MRRPTTCLLLALLLAGSAHQLYAQADAQAAFSAAKEAYEQDDFAAARDLFLKASHTDGNNPEVFLWLGKAHYELGDVEQALTAWQRTVKLAPDEPYANRMVKALRKQITDIDTRIRLVQALLDEQLYDKALAEARVLRAAISLTSAQRTQVTFLWCEALIHLEKATEVRDLLRRLEVTDPASAETARKTLLLGWAKLLGPEAEHAEGIELLKSVIADHPQAPEAASGELVLIEHGLDVEVTADRVKSLTTWVDAHPEHRYIQGARETLIDACLQLSTHGPLPDREATLSLSDKTAIDVLAMLDAGPGTRIPFVDKVRLHLETHYAARGAFAAALEGMETLRDLRLPSVQQRNILATVAQYRAEIVVAALTEAARSGQLAEGPLPQSLREILTLFEEIAEQFPANPAWSQQVELAQSVALVAGQLPPAPGRTQLAAPVLWAVEIAIPVVGSQRDAPIVAKASGVVVKAIESAKNLSAPRAGIEQAISLNQQLLDAVALDSPTYRDVQIRQAALISDLCHQEFAENRQLGKVELNAKLTDRQLALIRVLSAMAQRATADSQVAFDLLQQHLAPWIAHSHLDVAEQAYAKLAPAITPAVRRDLDLAVVRLSVDGVYREHARVTAAGLTVPRELNPQLSKALVRLYEMQAKLERDDPFLPRTRAVWEGIATHYRTLDYYDTAESAIKTAPEQTNENAQSFAELQLAHLRFDMAGRDLDRRLAQHAGDQVVQLTPEFQAAATAYTKFIVDRSDSPLASQAVQGIFKVAGRFEQHSAFSAAEKVYRDFAATAGKIPSLTVAQPGESSTSERAAFAVALSLEAEARRLLDLDQQRRKPDDKPPAQISDAFSATIDSYHQFVTAHPKSVLNAQAFEKIMAIALAYANLEAWAVADAIYAGELEARVGLRHPERLKFCRALCQLGPAMAQHAKDVLAVITTRRAAETGERDEATGEMLARLEPTASVAGPGPGHVPVTTADAAEAPADAPNGAILPGGPGGGSGGAAFGLPSADPQPDAAAQIAGEADRQMAERYAAVSQTIRQRQTQQATQIAMLRDQLAYRAPANNQPVAQAAQQVETQQKRETVAVVPVLSDAEIARIHAVFKAAYAAFHDIETDYPHTAIAQQARDEILVMVSHWRSVGHFRDAAQLAEQFLQDHPTDAELRKIRLEITRDLLAYAAKPIGDQLSKQAMLTEVAKRFATAHEALERIIQDFSDEKAYVQQAQWDIAGSYLTRARVVSGFSATLARGQYVRAARQLERIADEYYDHPNIGQIPQMLANIAQEMFGKGFSDEAVVVWTEVTVRWPTHGLAQQAARQIAQTYENQLNQPLKAAEVYQELNFAAGGNHVELQNSIYNIGVKLKTESRWVEALHVLETFVDTFPRHPNAGQTLTLVGEIHQANEAWEDAIAAYERAISEYSSGDFVKSAKWSIAECRINLSRWQEAIDTYRDYIKAYGDDEQAKTATARIEILKDLASYQKFVDEQGQRKADDAQFQIARIVHDQLSNPVKAIIEYQKVADTWPASHLADDALYKVGTIYVALEQTEKARRALHTVAEKYPSSSLADDALFLVGKSFEDESQKLATVTRSESLEKATDFAQKRAYVMAQGNKRRQRVVQQQKVTALRKAGKELLAENETAFNAAQAGQFDVANVSNFARQAFQEVETLSAAQLADREDKINAALRKAVAVYKAASQVAAGDKAAEALLRMAKIYDEQLKDADAAVAAWKEIVRQFSGTSVAEDASWRIAQYHERSGDHAHAIEAFEAFLRNYRRSPNAGPAQAAIAENYERLGEWIKAMDAYTNYLNNFPDGTFAKKAKDRINWIKTYRL